MNCQTVLIISDDAAFSHAITAGWVSEPRIPAFTLMSGDLCPGLNSEDFDVAIVGGLAESELRPVMKALDGCGKAVVYIREADEPRLFPNGMPRVMTLVRDNENWFDGAMPILRHALRSAESISLIRSLEQSNRQLSRDAALGRYILEMRHSLNNALTSVLGNSELLLLDPDALAPLDPKVRNQIDTMRNMALRMHEILQRFSSLEKELNVVEKQANNEIKRKAQSAAGSL